MSENKRSPGEDQGGVSFSLSGPALTSCLCLIIVLLLVAHLVSGCVPFETSIRNNEGDGSACVVWGPNKSDLPTCNKVPEKTLPSDTSSL
jgi:hypothetical protein